MEKEMWHASSNFRYLKDYGIKEEKFSVLMNLFFGFISTLLLIGLFSLNIDYLIVSILSWLGISGLFSIIKTYRITQADESLSKAGVLTRLFFLFNLYLLARYISIFKYKQYKVLFS